MDNDTVRSLAGAVSDGIVQISFLRIITGYNCSHNLVHALNKSNILFNVSEKFNMKSPKRLINASTFLLRSHDG